MGYNLSPSSILRHGTLLDPLKHGREVVWTVDDGTARRFAFQVREALRSAQVYADIFPELARYAPYYAIRVLSNTIVVAKISFLMGARIEQVAPHIQVPPARVKPGKVDVLFEVASRLESQGKFSDSFLNRMRALVAVNGLHAPLHVGRSEVTMTDLEEFYKWLKTLDPPGMILYDEETGDMTIAPSDPMMEEFEWKPKQD